MLNTEGLYLSVNIDMREKLCAKNKNGVAIFYEIQAWVGTSVSLLPGFSTSRETVNFPSLIIWLQKE